MSADTCLERLSSLVPRPRAIQVLYRGVLAAHSARRPRVVPEPDDDERHRPRYANFCKLHGLNVDLLARLRPSHEARGTIFDKKSLARLLRAKGLPHEIEPIRPANRSKESTSTPTAAVRGARAKAQLRPKHGREPRTPHERGLMTVLC